MHEFVCERYCMSGDISHVTHSLPAEYPEAVILHVRLQRPRNGDWHLLCGLRLLERRELLNNLLFVVL